MFDIYWNDISGNSILTYETARKLYGQLLLCDNLEGATAEIGVYEGYTSRLIRDTLNKPHYCYDTFEGIKGSYSIYGDKHKNGEFICSLEKVKQNIGINRESIHYKKGYFPNTFDEYTIPFCLVYSDTATYLGTKYTFEYFKCRMVSGGKIVFYIDENLDGVKNAITEFLYDDLFLKYCVDRFVVFTRK